jgi:hypothetical protein
MKTTFNLTWHGQEYSRRLHAELRRAVQQSALRVQRKAKELLNTSGKGVLAKAGINKIGSRTGPMAVTNRFKAGQRDIFNLKQVSNKSGTKTLNFGGNYVSGKSGRIDRVYWYAEPLHRWVQSSQPGTPPHKQTGTLQRSIAFQITHSGLRAKVGPQNTLIYGRIQELGGRGLIRLPPRPYLRPAFESQQQAILFQFALAIQKAGQQKP